MFLFTNHQFDRIELACFELIIVVVFSPFASLSIYWSNNNSIKLFVIAYRPHARPIESNAKLSQPSVSIQVNNVAKNERKKQETTEKK